jgi:hypothetical protein
MGYFLGNRVAGPQIVLCIDVFKMKVPICDHLSYVEFSTHGFSSGLKHDLIVLCNRRTHRNAAEPAG